MSWEGGRKSDFEWVFNKNVFTKGKDVSFELCRRINLADGEDWYLQMKCGPISEDKKTYIRLNLNRSLLCFRQHEQPMRTKLKLGLIAKDGMEKNVKSLCKTFTSTASRWGWDEFIRLDSLLDEENGYFKDDKLTIFCSVGVYTALEIPESTLGQDQSQMLESGDSSDFTLVVGGEELKLHKCVLSSGSPVFKAMLQHDTKENQEGSLEIEDLDVVGVKGLIRFLYTGEVEDLSEIAEEVLPAANKYGVERLKVLCEQEFCDKLGVENAADILVMADLYSAKQLKEQALRYISANSAELVKQERYRELKEGNQELFKEAEVVAKPGNAWGAEEVSEAVEDLRMQTYISPVFEDDDVDYAAYEW